MPVDGREEDCSGEGANSGGGSRGEQEQQKVRKARHLLHLPFTKSSKLSRRVTPPPYEDDLSKGCYLCFLPPRAAAVGTSAAGETNESKPPTYYEFLRSMIENNDFYSPECNIHRMVQPRERR